MIDINGLDVKSIKLSSKHSTGKNVLVVKCVFNEIKASLNKLPKLSR